MSEEKTSLNQSSADSLSPPSISSPEGHLEFAVREGEPDAKSGRMVRQRIYQSTHFVVFLDEDLHVCVRAARAMMQLPGFAAILNESQYLEALPVSHLTEEQVELYRTIIAQGVARYLASRDMAGAASTLETARRYIQARDAEVSRVWYVTGSSYAALAIVALAAFFGFFRLWIPTEVFQLGLAAAAGSLGAYLSIIARMGTTTMDPSAGRRIHNWEGACRILAGMIGGLLIGLAVKANIVLGVFSAASGNELPALLALCMVAGVSERLVPSFIRHVETSGTGRDTRESIGPVHMAHGESLRSSDGIAGMSHGSDLTTKSSPVPSGQEKT